MANASVDADVIIRLLTGDDPDKQAEAAALFEKVEARQLTLQAPDTVIADAVYVLSSRRLYAKAHAEVRVTGSQTTGASQGCVISSMERRLAVRTTVFTEEQIGYALRQAEAGTPVVEVARKLGVSEQTFYRWKRKFAGMESASCGGSG